MSPETIPPQTTEPHAKKPGGWRGVSEMKKASIKGANAHPPTPSGEGDHAHHWVIETPNGPNSPGCCKICKITREFKNSTSDDYTPDAWNNG